MLLYYGLGRFSSILSDTDLKLRYATWRKRLADALDAAWEEDRYVRQFGADGRAVGAPYDAECALDLSVQALSALSGAGRPDRAETAVKTALSLVDFKAGVVKSMDPPFVVGRGHVRNGRTAARRKRQRRTAHIRSRGLHPGLVRTGAERSRL